MDSLEKQKDQLHSIKALNDTDGGKELVNLLVKDIVINLHQLIGGGDHIVLVAEMKARLELVKLILGAEESEAHIDTLIAEALSE